MSTNARKSKKIAREKREERHEEQIDEEPSPSSFKSRVAKTHALKKTMEAMPKTPQKKAELLEKISSSPRTRRLLTNKGLIKTPEEMRETTALHALAADMD